MTDPFPDKSILDAAFRETLPIPEKTMAELFLKAAAERPESPAIRFLNARINYRRLAERVRECAHGLSSLGIREGDVVSLCMPNIPETVILFYAVNLLSGICNMIHPLAPAAAVIRQVLITESRALVFPDLFLERLGTAVDNALASTKLDHVIVVPMLGSADFLSRAAFRLKTAGKKKTGIPGGRRWIRWRWLFNRASFRQDADQPPRSESAPPPSADPDRTAVYLHSGGTTAEPKTIMLSDANFNAIACQIISAIGIRPGGDYPVGQSMITILPLFHGFGLCIGMHAMLANAMCCILVPRFTPEAIARIIRKQQPTLMAGVPTLYEALLHSDAMKRADLSSFSAFFCGGDSLPPELKQRFDRFLAEHGSDCRLREGYGLTETVTVCSLSHEASAGRSGIGVPLSNMAMKIIDPETREPLPDGQTGEICVTGPQMMKGYLNDPEATGKALVPHADGRIWVETGDLGFRDPDGFYHFRGRIKRMIKVSGIPVYPAEVEAIIAALPDVLQTAVIGIPHPYKMHVIKAFVRTAKTCDRTALENNIRDAVAGSLLRYAVPKEIEFVDRFPLTRIGKVDIRALEEQEKTRREIGTAEDAR